MRESKLHQWLSKLSTQEQNEFLRYVSVFGGRNRDELSQLLSLFLGKVTRGAQISREAFFAEWRPSEPFNPNSLNKRLTELKDYLDEFLALQEMRRTPLAKTTLLASAMNRRGFLEFAHSEHQDARKTLENAPFDAKSISYRLEIEEHFLQMQVGLARAPKKFEAPMFQALMQLAEEQYWGQTLRYAAAAMNQDRIFGTKHDYGSVKAIIRVVEPNLGACHPLVRLYFRICRMLTEPENIAHFEILLAELKVQQHHLDLELASDLYKHAINHCARRINIGEQEYYAQLASIYSATLKTGILLNNGQIAVGELKNMISLTAREGQIILAKELLEEYGPKLPPQSEWAITYNAAVIDYHEAVIAHQAAVEAKNQPAIAALEREFVRIRSVFYRIIGQTDDLFYDIDAKVYYLRVSNELGQFDMFEIQFDPLRVFLGRKRGISTAHKENYRQFIYHLKDLCRIRTDTSLSIKQQRTKLQSLLEKLESSTDIANIDWLRQKTREALNK